MTHIVSILLWNEKLLHDMDFTLTFCKNLSFCVLPYLVKNKENDAWSGAWNQQGNSFEAIVPVKEGRW